MDKKVRVRFTVRGKVRPDPDGINGKAALDGIVAAGVLVDDSADQIEEVSFRAELAEEDQTIIEIEQIL